MRLALAITFLSAFAASAAEPGPAATVQTQPIGKMLKQVREAAHLVAGDIGRKAIDDTLKTKLGEKGLLGLDFEKPVLGYLDFDKSDAEKVTFVALVPISDSQDFIALLERMGVELVPSKDDKELYTLGNFNLPLGEAQRNASITMRLIGKLAYIAFDGKPGTLDAAKVLKPESLYDVKETALVSYRMYHDRVPEAVLKSGMKNLEKMTEKLREEAGGDMEAGIFLTGLEKVIEALMQLTSDSKESGMRLLLNTETAQVGFDLYYVPKPESDFAKSVKDRKPTTNPFARLVTDETAHATFLQVPVTFKPLKDVMLVGLGVLQKKLKDEEDAPAYAKEIGEEAIKAVSHTIKRGHWDLGFVANGPDKDGHFSFILASSFDDALPLEKLIKKHYANFPAEMKQFITLDAETVSDLNIHVIEFPDFADGGTLKKVLGDSKFHLVFGDKGIYFAAGPNSKDLLKAAIAGKPSEAKAFEVLMNPKRIVQGVSILEPNNGERTAKLLGEENQLLSAISLNFTGGDSFRMTFSMSLKLIPKLFSSAASDEPCR